MNKKWIATITVIFVALIITVGCGGGGKSTVSTPSPGPPTPTPKPTSTPEGFLAVFTVDGKETRFEKGSYINLNPANPYRVWSFYPTDGKLKNEILDISLPYPFKNSDYLAKTRGQVPNLDFYRLDNTVYTYDESFVESGDSQLYFTVSEDANTVFIKFGGTVRNRNKVPILIVGSVTYNRSVLLH
ncbi:hypothetical protein [Armatimonas sp.]|uniref:hypothetical protein n=1 Tax=Armatimonas sp. TaxID=1872638 RepID=UPI00374D001D